MPRATVESVKAILPTGTTLTDPQINAAILPANCTVDQVVTDCIYTFSENCLKQMENQLAAHYAAATENTLSLKSEKDGCSDASATYGFEFGEGIMGTPFGQMANTLSRGCLKDFDKPPAMFMSLGSVGC